MRRLRGTVRWFDNLSQEGIIRFNQPGFESVYINNDPVHGFRCGKGKAFKLNSGDKVQCDVFEDYQWKQVSKLKVIK